MILGNQVNRLFSIVIPAYKTLYLREAIRSILNQTYANLELIIVDDASPEDIKSIVCEFNDARIRYYRNEKNCGAIDVVDNWNICLSYAKGDYIICMGDDDRLLPYCLEEYVKLMEKYPGLKVYHAGTELIDEKSNFYTLQQPRPEYETALSLAWNRWNGRDKQYIGDFCYEANALRKDGGFYKLPLAWGSDDITAVRAAMHGGIANMQVVCFQYRVNRHTITNTGNAEQKIKAVLQAKNWFLHFIKQQEENKTLSQLELKYLQCLKHDLPVYYVQRIKDVLSKEKDVNLLHFLKWNRNVSNYGIGHLDVLKCWIKALRTRLKRGIDY